MGKVAVLSFIANESKSDFTVHLQICKDDGLPESEITGGKLPANQIIEGCYSMWKTNFRGIKSNLRSNEDGWEIDDNISHFASNEGVDACRQYVEQLNKNMQNWLEESKDKKWQKIREKLSQELAKHPDMRLTVKSNISLWKLPWHCFDILQNYPDVGLSFSLEDYEIENLQKETLAHQGKVRILAVFGNNENLDLEPDKQAIRSLNGVVPEFLEQVRSQQLIEKLQDETGWDIFYFAGHSETEDEKGRIYINETEYLEINQFANTLKAAIRKGLKIVIFNSCQGSGLALAAAKLQIPVVIFMQEKVPDQVSHSFVKDFLTEYAGGKLLHTAFRKAQEKLEKFTDLPGCTGLPKLYQNLGVIPPTWQQLRDKIEPHPLPSPPPKPKLQTVLIASFIVTSLIVGVRSLGFLQGLELAAYDHLMRMRLPEKPDDRFLIITVGEEDIQYQAKRYKDLNHSLSDTAFMDLLNKLAPHQPRVIGLDIYRDLSENFSKILPKNQNFTLINICTISGSKIKSINPPPGITNEYFGFNNVPNDPDDVIRRQMLYRSKDDICPTNDSFSLKIALSYLKAKTNRLNENKLEIASPSLGNFAYPEKFQHNFGGYNLSPEEAMGYQILLNYRSASFPKISMREIFNGSMDSRLAELVKSRIVLIGIDKDNEDQHYTPYTNGQKREKLPGVIIQAHMASSIISAVLDNRSLLWWCPKWVETIWSWSWSIIGGLLIWMLRSPLLQLLAILATLSTIYIICLIFFLFAGWIPLIPSSLALIITSGSVIIYTNFSESKNCKYFLKKLKEENRI